MVFRNNKARDQKKEASPDNNCREMLLGIVRHLDLEKPLKEPEARKVLEICAPLLGRDKLSEDLLKEYLLLPERQLESLEQSKGLSRFGPEGLVNRLEFFLALQLATQELFPEQNVLSEPVRKNLAQTQTQITISQRFPEMNSARIFRILGLT